MTITVFSSRAFNQTTSEAKRAAQEGPVYITDRGTPSHVLLSFQAYQRLMGQNQNIAQALAMPSTSNIELELPNLKMGLVPAEFD